MYKSIVKLYGNRLQASDGDIGKVLDFYFDDRNWVVRYVAIDPENSTTDKMVLLSPHVFSSLHQAKKFLPVSLSRKQIENSPSADSHKPISRQFEEEFYHYYGFPTYWNGRFLWGMSTMPVYNTPTRPLLPIERSEEEITSDTLKHHLRCTKALMGYAIEAKDGLSGKVLDFILDAETWKIQKLVVKLRGLFSNQEVEILTSDVIRISYLESTLFVDMDRNEILESPDHYKYVKELVH